MIEDAKKTKDLNGNPCIDLKMNAEGTMAWARFTADNIGRSIAIVLDGTVYSYPTVQSEITGGRCQIIGNFTEEEAIDLANIIKCGKLPAPVQIIHENVTK